MVQRLKNSYSKKDNGLRCYFCIKKNVNHKGLHQEKELVRKER